MRTALCELAQDLSTRGLPIDHLDGPGSDLPRPALQLLRPGGRDGTVVTFLKAGEDFLRNASPFPARELEHLREKLFGGHGGG